MKKIIIIFSMLSVSMIFTGCFFSGNVSKPNIPEHEELERWDVQGSKYIELFEEIITDNYDGYSFEANEENETKMGKSFECVLSDLDNPDFANNIDVQCDTDGIISKIAINTYSKKDALEEKFFKSTTYRCCEVLIILLEEESDYADDIKETAEKLLEDGYNLELNAICEKTSHAFGETTYISPIDGGFKITDLLD